MERAMKSGIGSATVWLDGRCAGVRVAALVAVNAFGDVRDPESGKLVAGARLSAAGTDLADTVRCMKQGAKAGFGAPPARNRENTTLVVVATNARLNKLKATKLAQLANIGTARAISPPFTDFDGDLAIALSLGEEEAEVDLLGVAAAEAVTQAILRAVRLAPSLGGLPGLAG
jgi:L-aminopeptidase/D-esterase-like protein